MNIVIPYEKYINYNLLSLKKRTCEKQYETGHSKQLFLLFIKLLSLASVGGCADDSWLLEPSIGQGSS